MEFEQLSKKEEAILKAFLYIWNERSVSTIYINELKTGICFCKENNKWTSFHLTNNEKYDYKEFDNLFLLTKHFLRILNEYCSDDCLKEFSEALNKVIYNIPLDTEKYCSFDELAEDEKMVFDLFIKLKDEIGALPTIHSYPKEDEIDHHGLNIYKKGNKWVLYYLDRNMKFGYKKYDYLLTLCYDVFESLEKTDTDYCNEKFPFLIAEALEQKKK